MKIAVDFNEHLSCLLDTAAYMFVCAKTFSAAAGEGHGTSCMVNGMVHRFTAGQWLPYPVPFVFAFLADPHNLPGLMPAWQKARVEELKLVARRPLPPPHLRDRRGAAFPPVQARR
jgi:hypothetical protein